MFKRYNGGATRWKVAGLVIFLIRPGYLILGLIAIDQAMIADERRFWGPTSMMLAILQLQTEDL